MGSTGSGSFTDYSGSQGKNTGGGSGGSSGTDRCRQAFSCVLEEVAQCDFYAQNQATPATGTELMIVLNGRLFAVDPNGVRVGALPTRFNYLAACLASGIQYRGVVTASAATPVPTVSGDFVAL
jgi:hypothetical protein